MARVAFCQDMMVEYTGIMSMSAALKQAGHAVDVFIDANDDEDRLLRDLAAFRPDVVGFSVLTPTAPWALRIARRVHSELGAATILGNVHVIMTPEIIENEGVDIVCVGEGEFPMLALCAAIDAGTDYSQIRGLWVKTAAGVVKNPIPDDLADLDALPFHDRQIYNKYAFFRHSHYLRLVLGRGCPFHCTFCTNPVLAKYYGGSRYVRKLTPERAVAEIEHTVKNHPTRVKHIFFVDEVMWVRNDWLREFLALYRDRVHIPFTGAFRFGPIEEDDIRLMAEAGAKAMILAPESGDEAQRRGIMEKPVSDEQIFHLAALLKKHGISYGSSAFFGLPGDTVEDHVKRLDFFRKMDATYLWTTFFQPYPGIALTNHPEIRKYLPKEKEFAVTLHHDMYLDVPDRERLVRVKKVYFLCMKFPFLSPLLIWLTKFHIPLLFDGLFFLHFMYYAFVFERVSLFQWMVHVKTMGLNPFLKKFRRNRSRHAATTAADRH